MADALAGVVCVLALGAYYGWLVRRLCNLSPWVGRLVRSTRLSVAEVDSTIKITIAAAGQWVVGVLMVVYTGAFTIDASLLRVNPELLLWSALLGIAEAGLGTLLCIAAIQVWSWRRPTGSATATSDLALGGWMRHFRNLRSAAPYTMHPLLVVAYVSGEELVFRLGLMSLFGSGTAAIVISTACFVGVQQFNTPSWRAATFPMLGALVLGAVHAYLFAKAPALVPLVVAHVVFFFLAQPPATRDRVALGVSW